MFAKATVTMPYIELQELLNKLAEQEKVVKIYDRDKSIEKFEADPFKQSLDKVYELSEKASGCTIADEKQYYIHQIMTEYCRCFEMPEEEVIEGIPKGTLPNIWEKFIQYD